MRAELEASLARLAEDYRRQVAELAELHERLRDLSTTARTRDGLVTVVVGAQGDVRDIRLDPRVQGRLTPAELSETLLELIGEATGAVSDQVLELMEPFVPEDLPIAQILGADADLTTFAPQPAVPEEGDPDDGASRD